MKENYAEVLESYMIANEAYNRTLKISPEARALFNKLGIRWSLEALCYSDLSDFAEDVYFASGFEGLDKISNADLKKFHACFYNEAEALEFFAPSKDRNDVELIKKYKPIPIYANGMGDHYCLTDKLEIKEYIHDARTCFDASYSRDYKTFKEWLEKFYKPYRKDD